MALLQSQPVYSVWRSEQAAEDRGADVTRIRLGVLEGLGQNLWQNILLASYSARTLHPHMLEAQPNVYCVQCLAL